MARLVRADHSSHSEEIGRPREAGDGGGWRLGAAGANQRLSRFSARTFGLDAIQEMGIICNTSVTGTVRIRTERRTVPRDAVKWARRLSWQRRSHEGRN